MNGRRRANSRAGGTRNLGGEADLRWLLLSLVTLFLIAGCRLLSPTPTPAATLTPSVVPPTLTPTATHTPTPTATPTPTPTPIPPVYLSIEFPRPVTALEAVPIRVLVEEPPGIDAHVRLSARVIDAQDQLYATFDMTRADRRGWWAADETLQLPLEPEPYPGVWHLIIDAEADLPIRGYRDRVFTPQRVPYHGLTDTLPSGVRLHVPQVFAEVAAQGDPIAGLRTWTYRDCEVTLAWAPGPTEPLLSDTALVMAEATYPQGDQQYEISLEAVEQTVWGEEERIALLFRERWKAQVRNTPAATLVVQGPDYRLYALRIRAKTEDQLHPLCQDVRATFGFTEE